MLIASLGTFSAKVGMKNRNYLTLEPKNLGESESLPSLVRYNWFSEY